jgi:hypothetical protein
MVPHISLPNGVGKQLLLLLWLLLEVLLLLRVLAVLLLHVWLLLPGNCWVSWPQLAYLFLPGPTVHPLE